MKFHPDFHARQNLPWLTSELQYLAQSYESLGPEVVSLALERTIQSVIQQVCKYRRAGLMLKASKRIHHKRSGSGVIENTCQ